ncbi:MAG TPA: hypothetical protein VFQ80_03450 [Thermomicrobiales bacterium]|jgi:hypothetical protein|nr:hypothetical protein [Thermomicrobiales bacterium]
MDARRFDAIVQSLAQSWPRRRFVASAAAGLAAGARSRRAGGQAAARAIQLPCQSCHCESAGGCECCLIGITGGGVVRTDHGDVDLVLFATRLGVEGGQDAAGFVRWIDPHAGDGLTLESTGPVSYISDTGEARTREIRGLMTGGGGSDPFILRLFDAGPGQLGKDTAALRVGASVAEQTATAAGFGYAAQGPLVGGDLQLLGEVAPVNAPH